MYCKGKCKTPELIEQYSIIYKKSHIGSIDYNKRRACRNCLISYIPSTKPGRPLCPCCNILTRGVAKSSKNHAHQEKYQDRRY